MIGFAARRSAHDELYGDFDDVPEIIIPGTPHDYSKDTGPKKPYRNARKR